MINKLNQLISLMKFFSRIVKIICMQIIFVLFLIFPYSLKSFDIYNSSLQEEEILDLILYNKNNPLNINTSSYDEFIKIPYIDFSIASLIVDRISNKGKFITIDQLIKEKIMTDEIYEFVSECFYIPKEKKVKVIKKIKKRKKKRRKKRKSKKKKNIEKHNKFLDDIKINYNSRFKKRLQKSRAYDEQIYFGSDNYQSNKLSIKSKYYNFSFLTKKDAGEISNTNNLKYSFEYKFSNMSRVQLGFFKLKSPSSFIWDETSFRENFIVSSRSKNKKMKKYISSGVSSMDSYGLKGASVSFNNKLNDKFLQQFDIFYAEKDITANLVAVDDESNLSYKIKSIINTGYNRSIAEMKRYNNAKYTNKGFIYQIKDISSNKFYLASLIYFQDYNYQFYESYNEKKYNSSSVGDLNLKYSFSNANIINTNFAWNNNSNYSYNIILSHFFKANNSSSVHIKFQDQNISKYNPFSVSNVFNDEKERSFSFLFKGRDFQNIYFELQNDFYQGNHKDELIEEDLIGNKLKIQIEMDLSKNNQLKLTSTLKNEDQINNSENNEKYFEEYEKKIELKYKFKYNYGTNKKNNISLMSLLQYKDENDGFGSLLSENISFTINPAKDNTYLYFFENSKYKIRIGADSYYTKGKTLIYKNYFTTGLYTSLNAYSGRGVSIYFTMSYSFLDHYKITLGINENYKNFNNTFGSGYDEMSNNRVNSVELNFSYIL